MRDAISQKSAAPPRVLAYAFDTNGKNYSSGKAWSESKDGVFWDFQCNQHVGLRGLNLIFSQVFVRCFRLHSNVNFAMLKGLAVEDNLSDSVCSQVTACQRGEKHCPSATSVGLKVLVMLLQACCKELQSSSK